MSCIAQYKWNGASKYRLRINTSKCKKLLGIKIDCKLFFDDHIKNICKMTCVKLNALTRVAQYMKTKKECLTMNVFFSLQFNYCPLTWMFHNRLLNHKINILNERCLCVIYNNCHLSYDELVNLDNSVSMHQQNL